MPKLTYILATGSQYIDTGFVPNGNTTFELDWEPTDVSANHGILSARASATTTDSTQIALFLLKNTKYRYNLYGETYTITVSDPSARQKISTTKTSVVIGDVVTSVTQSTNVSPTPIYLMASNSDTSGTFGNYSRGKLYYVKIWDDGVLVRDMIPYLQNGVVGLLDKVNHTFYSSATSTPLEAGEIDYSLNLPVNIGGTWKDSESVHVNVDGTWKKVESIFVNVDGTWEEVGV